MILLNSMGNLIMQHNVGSKHTKVYHNSSSKLNLVLKKYFSNINIKKDNLF